MSEIIELLTLMPSDSPIFTVDTTGPLSVDLKPPPAYEYNRVLYASGAVRKFQPGDNITVLSAGFVFPESFTMAKAPLHTMTAQDMQQCPALNLALLRVDEAPIPWYSENFGIAGIMLPLENYEQPLGIFIDVYNLNSRPAIEAFPFRTKHFYLQGAFRGLDELNRIYPQVSMVGVPAALNRITMHATVFVKILHNFQLK